MRNPDSITPHVLPPSEERDPDRFAQPNRLQWGRFPLGADQSFAGWFLNGIPLLWGDVLERQQSNGQRQRVEYVGPDEASLWNDPRRQRCFVNPITRRRLSSLLLPTSLRFRWPPPEAARLLRAHRAECQAKARRRNVPRVTSGAQG